MGHELALAGQTEAALPFYDEATQGTPPTCDFSGEWIRAALTVEGPQSALAVSRLVWERRCAAAQGVRGAWAQSKLEAGDIDGAADLLTPTPARCTSHLALPMVTLLLRDQQSAKAKQCAAEAEMSFAPLQAEAKRLIQTVNSP